MVNKERIKNTFLDLVQIDSHSRRERAVADHLRKICEEMGGTCEMDDAGEKVGGNSGNLIARFPATISDLKDNAPLMFSSHMDTVTPGESVKPQVDGDVIRTDGTTILGSDDKSGLTVILETIRSAQEQNIQHTGIEAVFSICEEVGLLGARHVDRSKLKAQYGIVFDSDNPDQLFTRGPASVNLEFTVYGLEAHAGVAPEEGISAIKIAAEAIAEMRMGRIDSETTANIGVIEGGKATNIITNLVKLKGEARSLDKAKLDAQVAHMKDCFERAAARHTATVGGETHTGRAEMKIVQTYAPLNVPDDSPAVRLLVEAGARLGRKIETVTSGGGCDANIYNDLGIACANLGTGMQAIHTVKEYIDINDMCRAAELALEVLKLNGERATVQAG